MAEDLEDFLRRAAERRKQQTQAKLNKQPAAGEGGRPAPQQPRPAPRADDRGRGESPAEAKRREELAKFGDDHDARPTARPETPSRPEPVSRRPDEPRPQSQSQSQSEAQRPRRTDAEPRQPFASTLGGRRLAQGISQADERMESRLRSTFEHRVGQLDDAANPLVTNSPRPEDTLPLDQLAEDPAAAARSLAAAFRDPRFVRAAFIASEVFARKF